MNRVPFSVSELARWWPACSECHHLIAGGSVPSLLERIANRTRPLSSDIVSKFGGGPNRWVTPGHLDNRISRDEDVRASQISDMSAQMCSSARSRCESQPPMSVSPDMWAASPEDDHVKDTVKVRFALDRDDSG
jgi:hypothetical protein